MNSQELSSYLSDKYGIDEEKSTQISEAFISFDAHPKGRELTEIEEEYLRCNRPGFDGHSFKLFLETKFGIKKYLALALTRSIQTKGRYQKDSSRMINNGFDDGEWQFLSSCSGPHREKHRLLNGRKFPLNKGLFTDGAYLKPGDDWECGCAYRPVISLEKENPNEKLGILGKIMRLFSKRGS